MLMTQTLMDLDLRDQLLLSSLLGQSRLVYNFGCVHAFGVHVSQLVHFGKASLSEESALDPLTNKDIAVFALDLLFNEVLAAEI